MLPDSRPSFCDGFLCFRDSSVKIRWECFAFTFGAIALVYQCYPMLDFGKADGLKMLALRAAFQ